MIPTVQEKIRSFRDRAQRSRLAAAVTDERVVRVIYEDAARQWESLAENLERRARPGRDLASMWP